MPAEQDGESTQAAALEAASAPVETLYQRLAHELEDAIARGQLRAGERLPSVRTTCRVRGVSPATVFQAYGLLEAQGLNLSGVSVDAGGAHQQGAGGQSDDGQRAQARSARVVVNAAELPVDALNTRQVSRAAQTGVDLFV